MGIYRKILNSIIEFPLFFSLRAKDIVRKLLNPVIDNRLGCYDVINTSFHFILYLSFLINFKILLFFK